MPKSDSDGDSRRQPGRRSATGSSARGDGRAPREPKRAGAGGSGRPAGRPPAARAEVRGKPDPRNGSGRTSGGSGAARKTGVGSRAVPAPGRDVRDRKAGWSRSAERGAEARDRSPARGRADAPARPSSSSRSSGPPRAGGPSRSAGPPRSGGSSRSSGPPRSSSPARSSRPPRPSGPSRAGAASRSSAPSRSAGPSRSSGPRSAGGREGRAERDFSARPGAPRGPAHEARAVVLRRARQTTTEADPCGNGRARIVPSGVDRPARHLLDVPTTATALGVLSPRSAPRRVPRAPLGVPPSRAREPPTLARAPSILVPILVPAAVPAPTRTADRLDGGTKRAAPLRRAIGAVWRGAARACWARIPPRWHRESAPVKPLAANNDPSATRDGPTSASSRTVGVPAVRRSAHPSPPMAAGQRGRVRVRSGWLPRSWPSWSTPSATAGARRWRADWRRRRTRYERDRYPEAMRITRPLVDEVPESAAARELHGLVCYRLGRWREAVTQPRGGAVSSGDDASQIPVLMDCHRAMGHHRKVAVLWDELRASSPSADVLVEGRLVLRR